MRSFLYPDLDHIYYEEGLKRFAEGIIVLELKYDGPIPAWMNEIRSRLKLAHSGFSKYCRGVEAWRAAEGPAGSG